MTLCKFASRGICRAGSACTYKHIMCRYGEKCINSKCPFIHNTLYIIKFEMRRRADETKIMLVNTSSMENARKLFKDQLITDLENDYEGIYKTDRDDGYADHFLKYAKEWLDIFNDTDIGVATKPNAVYSFDM